MDDQYFDSDVTIPSRLALKSTLLSLIANLAPRHAEISVAIQAECPDASVAARQDAKLKKLYKAASADEATIEAIYDQLLRSSDSAISRRYDVGYELDQLAHSRTQRGDIPPLVEQYRSAAAYQDLCAFLLGFYFEAFQDSQVILDVKFANRGLLEAFGASQTRRLLYERMKTLLRYLLINKGELPEPIDYNVIMRDVRALQ